ncbi:MAG TPA: hypothetical protein H9907_08895 [Candidatus Corynebacterium intestinavium]|uniref:META domain-containing protein n=1 Tax=Candidatus Corynebacterium intestinavium TaxID=2838531 RepID=A0A9D2ZS26_9CORY|nr:hypothetical protein [Candidatus Corynebacterium intestinavium]
MELRDLRRPQRGRTAARAGAAILAAAGLLGLSACGESESPVGWTQWQVTRIYQNPETPADLPENQEGRLFLVIGEDSLTGASGCLNLTGDVQWREEESQLEVGQLSIEEIGGEAQCAPSDERNAERLRDVLENQTLTYTRDGGRSLRLQQFHPDAPEWETPKALSMVSRA